MWEKFREFILITFIAALIWLYAEGENVLTDDRDVDVEFAPVARDVLIKPRRPEGSVTATFRGNSAQLADLKELIRKGPLTLELSPLPDSVQQTVNLRTALSNLKTIADLGVTLLEVRPETVTVSVERMETQTLPLSLAGQGDTQLADVILKPEKVAVRLPASRMAARGDQLRVEARLPSGALTGLSVNQQHTLTNVPVVVPDLLGAEDLNVSPATVSVTFTIRKLARELVLPNVAVRLVAPLAALKQYNVQLAAEDDQFVRDIRITGPNDLIEKIEDREQKVWADVRLDVEDLAKGDSRDSVTIVPHIDLPPGVNLLEPPSAVRIRITKIRPATEP